VPRATPTIPLLLALAALAASPLVASPRADAARLGPVRLVAPHDGGYYDALSGTIAIVAGRARLAVRPERLDVRFLGVGVSTSMSGLRWSGWGTAHATARGEAVFCPDIGACRAFSGILVTLGDRTRLSCRRRRGDWITRYTRMTARLQPRVAASRLRIATPAALTC
jgi:hypothetical protein